MKKRNVRERLFVVIWLFIIFVSVLDGYLVWMYRDSIVTFERNPVGVALLAISNGGIAPLLTVKLLGTVFAGSWLHFIFQSNPSRGLAIAIPLAGFQLVLLLFLTCV